MIKLILCFSLFFVNFSYAQKNSITTTGKFGHQLFLSDVNGQAFINNYEGIVGSVYDHTQYHLAKITLKDGRVYNDVKTRINQLEQEVNFIASNGQEGYLGKGMALEVAYQENNPASLQGKVFQCGFPAIDNQNVVSFYQILLNGKTSLLKSVYKSIQERNNEISGERYKEFATYENMYLLKDGSMVRIKKDKSNLLDLLQDKSSALKKYMLDQKLNLKNETHLIELVKHYNTL
jgi:hypothetical protein